MNIKLNLIQAKHILYTNKDFIYILLDNNNKLISYKLSNIYSIKTRQKYSGYRVTSTLKNEIRNLTINI